MSRRGVTRRVPRNMDMSEDNHEELKQELAQLLKTRDDLYSESEGYAKLPPTTEVDEYLDRIRRRREHHRKYVNVHERVTTITNLLLNK